MKSLALAALAIWTFIFAYFLYKGVTTVPWEGDSLAYHLPLARNILARNFSRLASLEYYPGAGETILAIFMGLQLPLNLYNLLGWSLLCYMVFRLGKHFGLASPLAIVLATSVGALTSVVRLIPTQTIDIWLAIFYLWTVLLLESPQKTWIYFLKLGCGLGLIIGTKYSGPLFLLPLLIIYAPKFIKTFQTKALISLLPISMLGLSWYLRNWILKGNPLYPSGSADFHLLNWQLWKTPLFTAFGGFKLLEALISEYLVWAIAPLLALRSGDTKLKFLGFANLTVCMFLPTWPENIISDLRYTYIAFIPCMLAIFLWFQRRGQAKHIALVALATMVAVIPQLDYFPKLFFVTLLGGLFLVSGAPSRN